jgi:hypothetical protein
MARAIENEQTNLYLPLDVKKAGLKLADDRRLSFSQLVTQLIEAQLEEKDKQ